MWNWYGKLQGRSELTYQEIESWSRLTRTSVVSWEAEALRKLDRLFRSTRE